jgi:hypothetical protein
MVLMNLLTLVRPPTISTGLVGRQGDQGSEEGRRRHRRGVHEGGGLLRVPAQAELKLTSAPPTYKDVEQHHRRHRRSA